MADGRRYPWGDDEDGTMVLVVRGDGSIPSGWPQNPAPGANPAGYTTNRTFHSWIDGGFPSRLGLDLEALAGRLHAARSTENSTTSASARPIAVPNC